MGNQAYLCCCDHADIYPSFTYKDFDPSLNTLAAGSYALPITWLAMFRPNSLVERHFTVDGERVYAAAPISSRELCLDRLSDGIERFENLFSWHGKLAEYTACLHELLEGTLGEYVTIELEEIACLTDGTERFTERLRNIFSYLEGNEAPNAKEDLESMGGVDPRLPIYSPKGIYNRNDLIEADFRQAVCLIGGEHMRDIPWG